jgi:hypothetical protein
MFLFEIIKNVLAFEDRKEGLDFWIKKSKPFKDFMNITYNLNYNWEFDDSFKKKARSQREMGGVTGSWVECITLIKRRLVRSVNDSINFTRRLDRLMTNCNQKDIQIILCSLRSRSIKYIKTSKIYEWYPEWKKQENE